MRTCVCVCDLDRVPPGCPCHSVYSAPQALQRQHKEDRWEADWSTLGWPRMPSRKPLRRDRSSDALSTPAKGSALDWVAPASPSLGSAAGTPRPRLPRQRRWLSHCAQSRGKPQGRSSLGGEVPLLQQHKAGGIPRLCASVVAMPSPVATTDITIVGAMPSP